MSFRKNWINRFAKRSAVALAAASASAGLVNSAFAQTNGTYTFNGNDNWSDPASWIQGFVPNGIDADAAFGSTTAGVALSSNSLLVTLDSNRTVGTMEFSDSDTTTPAGWYISGTSTLRLQQSSLLGGTPTITVNGLGNNTAFPGTLGQRIAAITAPLSGTQGFSKFGNAGTLLITGNNTGLSGTISMDDGPLLLGNANALGTNATLIIRNGSLALRTDSGSNFGINSIEMRNDTLIGVGNSINTTIGGSSGAYGTGFNQTDIIGTITITGLGQRGLTISGSNGYGLTMGTLNVLDGLTLRNQGDDNAITTTGTGDDPNRHSNNVNSLGSGLVTIDRVRYTGAGAGVLDLTGTGTLAGGVTISNGISETGGGTLSLNVSNDKTVTISGPVSYSGTTAVRGNGTTIISSAALTNGQDLTITGGTLLYGTSAGESVANLNMGGGTILSTNGPNVISYLGLGAGAGSIATSGSINVSTSVLSDPALTPATPTNTIATINGKVFLGLTDKTINVQSGGDSLTITGAVSGSGGIIKTGKGSLNLLASNTFGNNLTISDGVVSGLAQNGVATPFGSTTVNVTAGGAIRLNGITSTQTESINSYTASDSGQGSGIIVDGSAGSLTTLSVGNFLGRASGQKATVLVVPFSGSLGTNENVQIGTGVGATNGMLDAYWAVQNSGANTQLSFANISGGLITRAVYTASGNPTAAASTDIFHVTSSQAMGGGANPYALGIDAGQSVAEGGNTLSLGTGGFGGLILNGGAAVTGGTLTASGTGELDVWSGGTGTNTISSVVMLGGDLTTGGATLLDMQGTINLGGGNRNVTTTGNAATLFEGQLSNGNMTKRGGGTLILGGANTSYNGNITVQNGILQVGATATAAGDLGGAAVTNNGTLMFHRIDGVTMANAIGGSGNLVQDPGTTTGVLTLSGNLNYTGKTIVRSGTLRPLFTGNAFPSTSALVIERNGVFDLNGQLETFASLDGTGTLTNSNHLTDGVSTTITLSSGSFGGNIVQSGQTTTISLNKVGSGELILSGNSSFRGTIRVAAGSLRVDSMAAVSSLASGTSTLAAPTIVLSDATLELNIPPQAAAPANLTPNLNVLINPLVFLNGTTGTISILSRNGQTAGSVSDTAGVGFGGGNTGAGSGGVGSNSITGGGTMVLDLRGRQIEFGQNATGFDSPVLMNFSGTLKFLDTNPVGSTMRVGNFVNATATTAQSGSQLATFAFGNGNLLVKSRNATQTFNMGFVSGGTNTILEAYENTALRSTTYQIGNLPGLQTFYGVIQDSNERGQQGFLGLIKTGSASTLTLTNPTLTYSQQTSVNLGTLVLASGANINNSPTIAIGSSGFATLAFGGGTYSTSQSFINMTSSSGAINVSGVPGIYSTRPLLTYLGNGTIYGNVNHNAGATNPGVIGTAGTMTFANGVTLSQNGNFTFDVTPTSNVIIGSGTHDLLKVTATNGLRIDGGVVRLNFIGSGTAGLSVGQIFPVISYAGTIQGAGLSALQAFATFPGSFTVFNGTGSLSNVIEAQAVNLNIPTVNLTWAPTPTDTSWDAATVRNFKPTGGSGSQFFFNGDTILFDDTADLAHHTVILGASQLAPLAVTVNTSQHYVFIGAGSMTAGSLVKNGTGTLSLDNFNGNSFAGGLTVNGGVVEADRTPAAGNAWTPWGVGTITLNNNGALSFQARIGNNTQHPVYAALVINGNNILYAPTNIGNQDYIPAGALVFGSGTLSVVRPVGDTGATYTLAGNMISFLGTWKFPDDAIGGSMRWNDGGANTMVGGPSITFDLGAGSTNITMRNAGSFMIGQLIGGTSSSVQLPAASTMTFGQKQLDSTFSGVLTGGGGGAFIKAGSFSTFSLTATQGYTNQTLINEGTLALVNANPSPLANSPTITIAQGATLNLSRNNGGDPSTSTLGGMIVVPNQTLLSNGKVTGGTVELQGGATGGGTTWGDSTSAIVADDNSTLSPGNNGLGTLTVGSLSIGAPVLNIEMSGSTIDEIKVTNTDGLVVTGSGAAVNFINLGGVVPGTYTFVDYSSSGDQSIYNGYFSANPGFPFNVSIVQNIANSSIDVIIANNSGKWFKNNGSDQWNIGTNWTTDYITAGSQVPASVEFGTFITAPQTVLINTPQVANNIIFNSPNSYTIAGTSTLTLDSGGLSGVTVMQGNHTIKTAVRLLHDVNVSVAATSNFTFAGTIINANNAQLSKIGNGSVTFTQLNMNTGSLTISAGTATLSQKATVNAPTGTSIVRNLSIVAGAKLNVTNNDFVIDTTANPTAAQLTGVRQELADGRLYSSLATSTTAIGYRTNAGIASPTLLGMGAVATFGGVTVDASSILTRLTLKGDTNLDGVVDINDLYNLANNFRSTTANWYQGDFNYDGVVNATDLSILSANWQQSFLGGEALGGMSLSDALASIGGLGNASVPEPTTLGLAGVAAVSLLGRRRRRRS